MTAQETLKEWKQRILTYQDKVKNKIPLSQQEQDDWDFIEQKLDDYRSDYYGQQND